MAEKEHWHLSKNVPIALIVTIAIQTLGIVWWAATISADVDRNRQHIIALESRPLAAPDATQRITRLETQYTFILNHLNSIDTKLDRLATP